MKERGFVVTGRCKRTGGCGTAGVYLHQGESIDSLLGRFKKNVIDSGVIDSYKESLEFVKPSVAARSKRLMRKRRARRSNID